MRKRRVESQRLIVACSGLLFLTLGQGLSTVCAADYSQPFASGHGFTWTATTSACDSSATSGDDSSSGNAPPSVYVECVGRNDAPGHEGYWKKTLTWEAMGVTPGETVIQVDGRFDHAIITRTHSSGPRRGPLAIYDGANSSPCAASDLEPVTNYALGTGATSWQTDNSAGAVAVNAGCQASSTSVTVRLGLSARTGNNAAATTRVNGDNLVLVITAVSPGGKKRHYTTVVSLTAPSEMRPLIRTVM
ncbi:MAG: hypothetical protein ACE145_07750 [Terriglobia bacterium]